MREIILIKNGELVLKGLNRNTFEDILIKNMKRALADIGAFTFKKSQSTIMVEPSDDSIDLDDAVEKYQAKLAESAEKAAERKRKHDEKVAADAERRAKRAAEKAGKAAETA